MTRKELISHCFFVFLFFMFMKFQIKRIFAFILQQITRNSLLLLKGLAGNDDVKVKIMQAGSSSLILMALEKHMVRVDLNMRKTLRICCG